MTDPPPSSPCRPLRADAVRNRALVLDAARAVFAERGLDASLDEVARRAGVGVATLYRRFPDRDELVEAVFEERIAEQVARLRAALLEPDASAALTGFLRTTCAELAGDRGMRQLFFGAARGRACMARGRQELAPLSAELVARARLEDARVGDLSASDIPVLLLMMSTVSDFAADLEPELWRRYFEVFLAGFRGTPSAVAALTQEQLELVAGGWAAVVRLRSTRLRGATRHGGGGCARSRTSVQVSRA